MLRMVIVLCALLASTAHAWDCAIWTSNVPGMECYKAPVWPSNASATQTQSQGQTAASNATASSAASSAASNNGSNVVISNDYARIPVATAFAAALTSAQCGVGSTSAGVQTPVVGLAFGTTRQNKEAKEYCRKIDAIRIAFMINPVVGCNEAVAMIPDIGDALRASDMTCDKAFAPVPARFTSEQVSEIVRKAVTK